MKSYASEIWLKESCLKAEAGLSAITIVKLLASMTSPRRLAIMYFYLSSWSQLTSDNYGPFAPHSSSTFVNCGHAERLELQKLTCKNIYGASIQAVRKSKVVTGTWLAASRLKTIYSLNTTNVDKMHPPDVKVGQYSCLLENYFLAAVCYVQVGPMSWWFKRNTATFRTAREVERCFEHSTLQYYHSDPRLLFLHDLQDCRFQRFFRWCPNTSHVLWV